MSDHLSLLKSTVAVVVARGGLGAVALVTDVVISRFLGPELKGEYYTVLMGAALLGTLAVLGQDYALNAASGRAESEDDAQRLFASSALVVTAAVGFIAAVTTPWGLPEWLVPAGTGIGLVLMITGGEGLFILSGMHLVTRGAPVRFSLLRVVRRCVVLIGALSVIAAGMKPLQAVSATLWWQFAGAAAAGSAAAFLAGYRGQPPLWSIRRLIRSGLQSLPARLAERFQHRFPVLLVAGLAGAEAVGLFSVALGISEILYFFTGSLGTVLFSLRDGEGKSHLRSLRLIAPLAFVVSIATALVGTFAIPLLYGSDFGGATTLLWLLAPGVTFQGLVQTMSPFMVRSGAAWAISVAQGAGMFVSVGLIVVLAAQYGASGAALAVSVGYAVSSVYCVWTVRRISGRNLRELLVPQRGEVRKLLGRILRSV